MGRKNRLSQKGLKSLQDSNRRLQEINLRLMSERIEIYNSCPKVCPNCNSSIPYSKRENTFCSRTCSASFNNRKTKKKETYCKVCGKSKPHRNIYCSLDCHYKDPDSFIYFDIHSWLLGSMDGGRPGSKLGGPRHRVRRFLLEECGNKCSKCGWNEIHPVTNKVPLEINHIDGDAFNNTRSNLEVLCPNCHSLTLNFRALNKESSRKHRSAKPERTPKEGEL